MKLSIIALVCVATAACGTVPSKRVDTTEMSSKIALDGGAVLISLQSRRDRGGNHIEDYTCVTPTHAMLCQEWGVSRLRCECLSAAAQVRQMRSLRLK